MKNTAAIAAANSRAERAEAAALETHIRLAIANARLAELEAAEARRKDAIATAAVLQLAMSGVIRKGDLFTHHEWKQKFLADRTLMPLCLCRPYNQRKRATK